MSKAVFQLETLTCPSCVSLIEKTLRKTVGIDSVNVLFNSSKVRTEFNEETIEADKIQETIRKLGYQVLSMKVS